ncbi:MAG: hypothetical protein Q3968_02575 [Clostridiaceae bacterium]|nr:hypothetical protein [Clostridiaceae bacterium]
MKTTISDWKGAKIETVRRLGVSVGSLLIILAMSVVLAPKIAPNSELFDQVGMALAIVALSLLMWRFPLGTYAMAQIFTLTAAAGSILKFYDRFPGYDRVVHFVSGVILGYIGYTIGYYVVRKLDLPPERFVITLIAGLFAYSCAGFWEIIEFTTDCVMHMGVQHSNTDTMGDIVAGFFGGAVFQVIKFIEHYKEFKFDRLRSFFKN